MRVLFAASEVYPLAKTGGLADVAAALPAALVAQGIEVCIIMPAYRTVAERLTSLHAAGEVAIRGQTLRLLAGKHPDHGVPMLLVDAPELFARPGNPYGHPDDALRFGAFCEVVARVALGNCAGAPVRDESPAGNTICSDWDLQGPADVIHLNDWHSGLVPAYLPQSGARPRTVFTIHNLAYQGNFDRAQFDALGLSPALWHPAAIEFWGGFSFMKAGLVLADALTTVSPTYAREIQTAQFGESLDGVLRLRSAVLSGILNGIDTSVWNPSTDALIEHHYDATSVTTGKAANKLALQRDLGLQPSEQPLLGFIGRLAYQKGADALLAAGEELSQLPLQMVILASGDAALEHGFSDLAARHPDRIAVRLAYDERLAHRIEAASDFFIMPSRYEPCGLNQMYSQRYGTVPLVRRVGGLADSVDDISGPTPSGIHFENTDAAGVSYAVRKAIELHAQAALWRQIQQNGMARDWSWRPSATRYIELYQSLLGT
ncbi:MAG TPA: glycogen synthase [Xanthomonadales bacterium]|nr:glycogen synthase [Xanthomonadales bacterium]